jgi:ribonucleoside-triphosphate reductase
MQVEVTYDKQFEALMSYMRAKYPEKLFDIEGIGSQLDFAKFSKDFFSTKTTTADVSVDANANVDDASIIAYNVELGKPIFRLNALFLIWKYMKQLYGLDEANRAIEAQVNGEVYINDMHSVNTAYSYYGDTPINILINGEHQTTTMRSLYDKYCLSAESDQITDFVSKFQYGEKHDKIEILDNTGWVSLERILKHKRHNKLLVITTKNGNTTIVTEDHPVVLSSGKEKIANKVIIGDVLCPSNTIHEFSSKKEYQNGFGYFLGFFIGDGAYAKNTISIFQKNISTMENIEEFKSLFGGITFTLQNRSGTYCSKKLKDFMTTELGIAPLSFRKTLPNDVFESTPQYAADIISGMIDSDGTVNPDNGLISIRMNAYGALQQTKDVLLSLGIQSTLRMTRVPKGSANTYRQQYEMVNLSFRISKDKVALFNKSIKINKNIELVVTEKNDYIHWNDFSVESVRELTGKHLNVYDEYVFDVTTSSGYFISCGLKQHNCFNFSCYDIMTQGLPFVRKVKSLPAKHLSSFIGQMIHFTVYASNSIAGACGLADLLVVTSYYVDKLFRENGATVPHSYLWKSIKQELQSFIYSCNQPFRAGHQSGFYNISVFDKFFLEDLCSQYIFPDGSSPNIMTIQLLQEMFLDLMNETLDVSPITFPVTTACFSVDSERNIQDEEFLQMISQKNMKYGFVNIYTGETSTLSSCCRLRSSNKSEYFNSFGSGGTKIGSLGVVTINLPRIAYDVTNKTDYIKRLKETTELAIRINNTKRFLIKKRIASGAIPLYDLGFMDINKQYSTTGINGLNEALEIMGLDILKEDGQEFVFEILNTINDINDKATLQYKAPHNTEQTPSESSAVKLATKDRLLGFQSEGQWNYTLYSNQFIPLTTKADLLDRIRLQGLFDSRMSGGAICHLNIETRIEDPEKIANLIRHATKQGVVYSAINYTLQRCENEHMTVGKGETCNVCGSKIVDEFTRVVGFLTNVKNWNKVRREEEWHERKFYKELDK